MRTRLISGSGGGWARDREVRKSVQSVNNVQRIIAGIESVVDF